MRRLALCLVFCGYGWAACATPPTHSAIVGPGCTTTYHYDYDGDGYGVGTDPNDPDPLLGPDADDNDATVHTAAQWLTKWGTVKAGLQHNGYTSAAGFPLNHIWYVSTTGTDSTSCRDNNAAPCRTFAYVYGQHAPGDAMLFHGGTYVSNQVNAIGGVSTSSSAWDLIMSYPGELAVFDDTTAGIAYGFANYNGNVNYLVIDGIKLSDSGNSSPSNDNYGHGIGLPQSGTLTGFVLRNSELRDWDRAIWICSGSTQLTIERNVLHDDYSTGGSGEHNIYLCQNSYAGGVQAQVTVQDNVMYNAARDNFHFNGECNGCVLQRNIMSSANMVCCGSSNIAFQEGWHNGTIQDNIVFNSSAFAISFYDYFESQAGSESCHGGSYLMCASDENYNVIRNNTLVYTGRDWSGQSLSGGAVISVVNSDCTGSSGTSGTGCLPHDMGNNTYDNNIIVDMNASPSLGQESLISYGWEPGDACWLCTDTYRNNIIYDNNSVSGLGYGLFNWITYAPPLSNYATLASTAHTFTGNLQSSPQFVAASASYYNTPGTWNLRTQSGSPAIGAAYAADAPPVDITGASRGSSPDIGAYQFSSSSTCTITTSSLPPGTVGVAYSQTVGTSGCASPTFSISVGSLPSPLTIGSSTGTIAGTPVGSGTSSFTVSVSDVNGNPTQALSITINPAVVTTPGTTVSGGMRISGPVVFH